MCLYSVLSVTSVTLEVGQTYNRIEKISTPTTVGKLGKADCSVVAASQDSNRATPRAWAGCGDKGQAWERQ